MTKTDREKVELKLENKKFKTALETIFNLNPDAELELAQRIAHSAINNKLVIPEPVRT